jgi:5-methylcytosine-specific restriction enzyme A
MPYRPKTFRAFGQPSPAAQRKQYDKARGSSNARGYDSAWREHARWFLNQAVVVLEGCALCGQPATCVDHIEVVPADDPRWIDLENNQQLCTSCNVAKGKGIDQAFRNGTLTTQQLAELDRMLVKARRRAQEINAQWE